MLTLISLQKKGAAPKDDAEISASLFRNKINHQIIINESVNNNVLKYLKANKIFKVKTYKSKKLSFIIASILLTRPLKILKKIKESKGKILFATHFHPWLIYIFLKNFFKKNKWIIIYGIHENPYKPKEAAYKFIGFLEKIYLKQSNYIFAHSNFLADDLKKANPKLINRIFVTPTGSYFLENHDLKKWRSNFSDIIKLIFIGRIESYKGIDTLLKAFEYLKKHQINNIELGIFGNGLIREEQLNKINNLNIKLKNEWLKDDDVSNILKDSNLIVVPYDNATQSGVINIARAFGVPSITSNAGGLPEQIKEGETGLIFEVGDYKSLAEKIVYLNKNRHILDNMSKKCLELNNFNDFNWQKTSYYIDKILKQELKA